MNAPPNNRIERWALRAAADAERQAATIQAATLQRGTGMKHGNAVAAWTAGGVGAGVAIGAAANALALSTAIGVAVGALVGFVVRTHGAELVGEVAQYEELYRLCYVRGSEGIIMAPAEQMR
jgi:hypothetical protein